MEEEPMVPNYGSIMKCENIKLEHPPQTQPQQPGIEAIMVPRPISENPNYIGTGKLLDKVAIITGGDSGIGRAVSYAFAKEGAHIVIVYLNEHIDAEETKARVLQLGRGCLTFAGDIGEEGFCRYVVDQTVAAFGRVNILVNNAAEQHLQSRIEDISAEQLLRTFKTNIFSYFYFTKAVAPYLKPGSAIVNTSSVTADRGYEKLLDYSATKGAIDTFTRSLALSFIKRGIRVNTVAPGETWTSLIPASLDAEGVALHGSHNLMKRTGQPAELAPAYVYLASEDSSFVTGQIIHINGGEYFGH
jgi:NAD(P)-dependent dehydrogenase (short-subunit alcohol dehydrogenase family)